MKAGIPVKSNRGFLIFIRYREGAFVSVSNLDAGYLAPVLMPVLTVLDYSIGSSYEWRDQETPWQVARGWVSFCRLGGTLL